MLIKPGGALCGCGKLGCLEAQASGTAIMRDGRNAMELGRAPTLRALADAEGGIVTAELVARAAELGDIESAAIIARAGEALGLGLGNLVNVLNPDVVVIGGGVTRIGERLLGPAEQGMHAAIFARSAQRLEFRTATLDYAASAGLAALIHGQ